MLKLNKFSLFLILGNLSERYLVVLVLASQPSPEFALNIALHSKSLWGGRPTKLSPATTRHAIHLIRTGKADNAAQITKPLADIISQPLSTRTVSRHLKKAGMKAVVKRKRPFLKKAHRKARYDWALAHQHWTVEDWKKVVYADETKINRFGSDGRRIV